MSENGTLVTTKIDWASLNGVTLEGGCELKDALEVRDEAARLRVRILGSGGRLGTAYFLALEPKEANDQLDIWQTLREVPHPNLSTPLAVGRREVSGVETVYAVMADPDEKLATVVPERPLEWEEAAEVLQSAEKGLAHLHAYGLMHGSVSPDTVQAVGYSIQLDTESVRRLGSKPRVEWSKPKYLAPESRDANLTTAADVWCLGATLFEVLAQERYGVEGASLEEGLPLGAVIVRCLEKDPGQRCTLKEAPGYAKERPPAAPPAPTPAPTVVVKPEVKVEAAAPKVEAKAAPVAPSVVEKGPPPMAARESEPPSMPAKPAVQPATAYSQPVPVTPPPAAPAPAAGPPSFAAPASKPLEQSAPAQAATAARQSSASRLPQPLTPKGSLPRQITKEDMALVPLGKRHKKVAGKRLPVDARIRTLDGPIRGADDEGMVESGPAAVVARMLGLGTQSNFVRGILAGSLLAVLFVAAIWFIIIPKLQSTHEPATSPDLAQTGAVVLPAEKTTAVPVPPNADVTTAIPMPGDAPPAAAAAAAKAGTTKVVSTPGRATNDPLTVNANEAPPVRPMSFRVILAAFDNQTDAFRRLTLFSQQHPDLLLHVVSPRGGDVDKRYLLVAGGLLTRTEADDLRQRLQEKGLTGAHVERSR